MIDVEPQQSGGSTKVSREEWPRAI